MIGHLQTVWRRTDEPVSWWYNGWVADQITRAPQGLDDALERWRSLYRAALVEYQEQGKLAVAIDPSATVAGHREPAPTADARSASRSSCSATRTAEIGQTDFYSYRYLASEGFLPGYSFPRLPLAAYIPGGRPGRGHATATTSSAPGSWRSASSAPER